MSTLHRVGQAWNLCKGRTQPVRSVRTAGGSGAGRLSACILELQFLLLGYIPGSCSPLPPVQGRDAADPIHVAVYSRIKLM